MTATRTLVMALVAAFVVYTGSAAEAGPQRYGDAIDPKAPKVTLANLLAQPDAYAGKYVVVNGNFAGKCCGSDFYFKDKLDMIEVTPPGNGEQCMLLKAGTPISLYGRVNVIQRENEAPIVSMEGKAVEVREVPGKKKGKAAGRKS